MVDGFVVDGHKGFPLFVLRRKMGSFGILPFWGDQGVTDDKRRSSVPPSFMVARRVGRTGRNGRKGVESRGNRDLEFGKWVRGARESLRRSYFPRRVWGEFWQGARPALQIVGLTGDRIVAGAV